VATAGGCCLVVVLPQRRTRAGNAGRQCDSGVATGRNALFGGGVWDAVRGIDVEESGGSGGGRRRRRNKCFPRNTTVVIVKNRCPHGTTGHSGGPGGVCRESREKKQEKRCKAAVGGGRLHWGRILFVASVAHCGYHADGGCGTVFGAYAPYEDGGIAPIDGYPGAPADDAGGADGQ